MEKIVFCFIGITNLLKKNSKHWETREILPWVSYPTGRINPCESDFQTDSMNDKIYLTKLVAWNVIFTSVAIPKASMAWLLISRAAVARIRGKSLRAMRISHIYDCSGYIPHMWLLCVYPLCEECLREIKKQRESLWNKDYLQNWANSWNKCGKIPTTDCAMRL
jgi:hypothetical protein